MLLVFMTGFMTVLLIYGPVLLIYGPFPGPPTCLSTLPVPNTRFSHNQVQNG